MTDPTIRRVLDQVERQYIEPDRIDAGRMLAAALQSEEGAQPGDWLNPHEKSLADTLGPALERALLRESNRWPAEQRNHLRAELLDRSLRPLDPFSKAVTGSVRRRLIGRFTGSVCGIGVRIGKRDGGIQVLHCCRGSSAAVAGIRAGDRLLTVAGNSVNGSTVAAVIGRIRGPSGTVVRIGVEREGRQELPVTRRPFPVSCVAGRLVNESIGLIRIKHMSKNLPGQLDQQLDELGERATEGWVLDLRGNTGGSMLAAAAAADRFLDHGIIFEALDRSGRPVPGLRHRVEASPGSKTHRPIVVLVDERTASAAELFTAALLHASRAQLVGRRTRGKNSIQKMYN
jgi:carboxyl-terminal processing protease